TRTHPGPGQTTSATQGRRRGGVSRRRVSPRGRRRRHERRHRLRPHLPVRWRVQRPVRGGGPRGPIQIQLAPPPGGVNHVRCVCPAPPRAKAPPPRSAVRANLSGLLRGESDVKMAFAAKDFHSRTPLRGDLREPLLDRLGQLFDDLDPTEEKGATWAGQPALKY